MSAETSNLGKRASKAGLLVKRHRKRLERLEAMRLARLQKFFDIAHQILPPSVDEAWVFGSTAQPNMLHEESDLDLAYRLPEGRYDFQEMARVGDFFKDCMVEVVDLKYCPAVLLQQIQKKGIRWTR